MYSEDNIEIKLKRIIGHENNNTTVYINETLTLTSITGVNIPDDNPAFIWRGSYNENIIEVILPRGTSEVLAEIKGVLPDSPDPEFGSVRDQIFSEVRRILRKLN